MKYYVELTMGAELSFAALPTQAAERVESMMRSLSASPGLGHMYDPGYPAATPPVPLRVLHVANYGIYYSVDTEREIVTVRFIEDQRMDPDTRFTERLSRTDA